MPPLPPATVNEPWFRRFDEVQAAGRHPRASLPSGLAGPLNAVVQDAEREMDPELELRAAGGHRALSTAASATLCSGYEMLFRRLTVTHRRER